MDKRMDDGSTWDTVMVWPPAPPSLLADCCMGRLAPLLPGVHIPSCVGSWGLGKGGGGRGGGEPRIKDARDGDGDAYNTG